MLKNSRQLVKTRVRDIEDKQTADTRHLTEAIKAMNDALANGRKATPELRQTIDNCST